MSDQPITDAELANWNLIASAAQLKAPSPWDRETQTTDGESIAYNELSDANGKVWADSVNSSMSMTCEDFDEDGVHLYDCGTLEVFEHMQTFDPETVTRLLAAYAAEHDSAGAWASRAAASGLQVEACIALMRRARTVVHGSVDDFALREEMRAMVDGWGGNDG